VEVILISKRQPHYQNDRNAHLAHRFFGIGIVNDVKEKLVISLKQGVITG
jgi:hypothetical protein